MIRRKYPPVRGTTADDFREPFAINITLPSFTDAACADHDNPDLWFAHEVGQAMEVEAAQAICETCPARAACLAYAVAEHIEHGIWGGVTAKERHAEERRARWQQRQAKFTGARRRTA